MIFCDYAPVEGGFQCSACGHAWRGVGAAPTRLCFQSRAVQDAAAELGLTEPVPPGLAQAVMVWVAAGKPRRTDAERENQAVICRTCPRRSRCDAASVGLHKMATWHCRAGESPAIPDDGPQPNKGPGDYLHDAILRWVGESPTADCQCRSRIARMNAWGPAGCREHLEEIVGWLAEEAKKRGWWRYAVCMPGSRLFLRRLVLRAIRKTEREAGVNLGA